MENQRTQAKERIRIEEAFPKLDPDQREAAEENLDRYVALALRIFERVRSENDASERPSFDKTGGP